MSDLDTKILAVYTLIIVCALGYSVWRDSIFGRVHQLNAALDAFSYDISGMLLTERNRDATGS